MFVCPTRKTAKDVWYDTKGDSLDEDIYRCLKCVYYFTVSAVCGKRCETHSRTYDYMSKNCDCMEYYCDHKKGEIEKNTTL